MDSWKDYLNLINSTPQIARQPEGAAIVTLSNKKDIARARRARKVAAKELGWPASWEDIGVVFEDEYLVILRDPVRFPSGEFGTYLRIIEKPVLAEAVIVIPMLNDKFILLNHYRHATRDWSIEFPRGMGEGGSWDDEARRELTEEIGADAMSIEPIGIVQSNNGLFASRAHVVLAQVSTAHLNDRKEGISEIIELTWKELMRFAGSGKIQDSFSLSAAFLMLARNRLPEV